MAKVPPPEEQEWLLQQLYLLLQRQGSGRFLDGPILRPVVEDFPDPWHGDLPSLEALCRRLLAHVGLDHLDVRVEVEERPVRGGHLGGGFYVPVSQEGTAAWFAGIHNGTVHFGTMAEHLDEPGFVVGVMGHEVAHAWRAWHGLAEDPIHLEERLTDLSTVVLGFGLLTANASWRFSTSSDGLGHSYSRSEAGYLGPHALSFLLAAQVVARELGFWERRRLASWLHPNQRGFFRAAHKLLVEPRGRLRWMLGLPSDYAPPEVELGSL